MKKFQPPRPQTLAGRVALKEHTKEIEAVQRQLGFFNCAELAKALGMGYDTLRQFRSGRTPDLTSTEFAVVKAFLANIDDA